MLIRKPNRPIAHPYSHMGVNAAPAVNSLLHQINTHNPKYLPTNSKFLTSSILADLNSGRLQKAVSTLFAYPLSVPFSLYARLFQICASNRAIVEARKVESHLITFTPNPPIFLLNRAIETYGKCGCLGDARELFDEMPERDGGSWNSMITAYSQGGHPEKALSLFLSMNRVGVLGNEITFASVLGSCAAVLELSLSRQIHGCICEYGFCRNVILGSSLVDVYGKCGFMSDARKMFDEIQNPNEVSWNVIVKRYLEMGYEKESVFMFFEMIKTDARPLSFTGSNALVACSSISALEEGIQIHGFAVKLSFEADDVVLSSLLDMYVKCGDLGNARLIFDLPFLKNLINWTSMVSGYAVSGRTREAMELFNEMPDRGVISWNAMLSGYTRLFQWEEALDFFLRMRKETQDVDHVTLGLILNVCSGLSDVEMGKQTHGFIYRHGFYSNLFVGNALLDMYGKCGHLRSARVWFHQMNHMRDRVSWNTLLTSYASHRMSEEAMTIFWEMRREATPSKYTFGILLAACANIFALEQGKQIHGFILRNGYEIDVVIRGAFVDMYSKCNSFDYAFRVCKGDASWDLILCNSMILGLCHNGRGGIVFELFDSMEKEGMKPDNVTFHGLLLACICESRVELGENYFNSMSEIYGVIPRLEHYESMIELYGRYGFIDELDDFIKKIPFEPTITMLTRVFDACQEYKHLRLGNWATYQLNKLNPSVPFQFQVYDKSNL